MSRYSYHYDKQLGANDRCKVEVEVFLLRVSRQRVTWPEQAERETSWFDPNAAAALIVEPELAAILRGLSDVLLLGRC